jgi:hypothetical protein
VMKEYLLPIISPSKYVVRLGWSSVSPARYQFMTPSSLHCRAHL